MFFFNKSAAEKAAIKDEQLAAFFNSNTDPYKIPKSQKRKAALYGSIGEHFLQEKYHTQQQANAFYSRYVSKLLAPTMQEFIIKQELLFITTANKLGECECSCIVGEAGFIHVLDEHHLIYPLYHDEEFIHLKNNINENPHSAILIIDFFKDLVSLHINGKARVISSEQLLQFKDNFPAPLLAKLQDSYNDPAKFWLLLDVEEAYGQQSANIPLLEKLDKQHYVNQSIQQPSQEFSNETEKKYFLGFFNANNTVLINSILVLLGSVAFLLLPIISSPTSVQTVDISFLWHTNFWQQVTGYTLLTVVIIGLSLSLHKHITILRFKRYVWWRLFHIITGIIALGFLILHTGLSVGNNYNFILMLCFISTLIIGGITGILTALEANLPYAIPIKKWVLRFHIAVVLLLPVLVGIHILSVYYF